MTLSKALDISKKKKNHKIKELGMYKGCINIMDSGQQLICTRIIDLKTRLKS